MEDDDESHGDALVESVVRSPLWQKHDEFDRRLLRVLIESYPQEALEVFLKTGALAPAGVLDTESGLLHVCGPDDEPEPQDVPVYRLATEENPAT